MDSDSVHNTCVERECDEAGQYVEQVTILRDNREQKDREFKEFGVAIRDETINTGDYTLGELCDHDEDRDTYYPRYAVKRKSGPDFIGSITQGRGPL